MQLAKLEENFRVLIKRLRLFALSQFHVCSLTGLSAKTRKNAGVNKAWTTFKAGNNNSIVL
jgi:hypothetical protein